MSMEARMREQIDEAVRLRTEPLEKAVEALSARLAAVEGSSGTKGAEPAKRAAGGRTAKAKALSADATATSSDPFHAGGSE